MRFKRLTKLLFATASVLFLTADGAHGHAGHTVTFSSSSYALNANANITSGVTFGAVEVDTLTIDVPAGIKLAHDDQFGNELASNPDDEASIGSGTAKASWSFLFCGVGTVNLSASFEEDMTGAPANAVAHYQIVAASVGTYDVWAIEENDANDDYKLTVDLNQIWTCSSASQPSDANTQLTINGTATGGVVAQNPSATGCYSSTVTFIEVGGTSHSGSAGRNYTAGTSC
jgi:hypothetical protein